MLPSTPSVIDTGINRVIAGARATAVRCWIVAGARTGEATCEQQEQCNGNETLHVGVLEVRTRNTRLEPTVPLRLRWTVIGGRWRFRTSDPLGVNEVLYR